MELYVGPPRFCVIHTACDRVHKVMKQVYLDPEISSKVMNSFVNGDEDRSCGLKAGSNSPSGIPTLRHIPQKNPVHVSGT